MLDAMLFIKHPLKLEVEQEVINIKILTICNTEVFRHLHGSYYPPRSVLQDPFLLARVILVCSTADIQVPSHTSMRLVTYS